MAQLGIDPNLFEHIQLPNGMRIYPDRNVPDIRHRSVLERLFTRPWRPFLEYEKSPTAFMIGSDVIVSRETFNRLIKGEDLGLLGKLAEMPGFEPRLTD